MYHPNFQGGALASEKFDLWFVAAFQLQIADPVFDADWWCCAPDTEGDHEPLMHYGPLVLWFKTHSPAILSRLDSLPDLVQLTL